MSKKVQSILVKKDYFHYVCIKYGNLLYVVLIIFILSWNKKVKSLIDPIVKI